MHASVCATSAYDAVACCIGMLADDMLSTPHVLHNNCHQAHGTVPMQGLLDRADAAAPVRGIRHLCGTCFLHVRHLHGFQRSTTANAACMCCSVQRQCFCPRQRQVPAPTCRAEKLFGVHSKAYPLRILARVPVGEF